MHDAHFHFSDEIIRLQDKHNIPSLCNAADLKEWKHIEKSHVPCSCGIHPWTADHVSLKEMRPLLEQANIIGEIGMDSCWCSVDPAIQKKVFTEQIKYAYANKKPVILHTKGQEKEILDIIREYPNTYIAHWYSCSQYIEEYNEIASYFTIGPSVVRDQAVANVVRTVPIQKLLIESDGIDAVEWAVGHRNYIEALKNSIETIAAIKGLSVAGTEKILDANFERMINRRMPLSYR